jgi:thymidylate kinase
MKKVHLFIDGPDGAGKSTVCKDVGREMNIPIIKMPVSAEVLFDKEIVEDLSYVFNFTLTQFERYSFVVDRGFLTSLVYSKVYERKWKSDYIETVRLVLKPLVVVLTARPEVLKNRRVVDDLIPWEVRVETIKVYEEYAKKYAYKVIDTSDLEPIEVFQKVRHEVRKKYGF